MGTCGRSEKKMVSLVVERMKKINEIWRKLGGVIAFVKEEIRRLFVETAMFVK